MAGAAHNRQISAKIRPDDAKLEPPCQNPDRTLSRFGGQTKSVSALGFFQEGRAQATLKAAAEAEKPAVSGMRNNWQVQGFIPVTQEDGTVISGQRALLLHYLKTDPGAITDACLELARIDVRNGKRTLPGVVIENERRAV